jgi:hypothetical protein
MMDARISASTHLRPVIVVVVIAIIAFIVTVFLLTPLFHILLSCNNVFIHVLILALTNTRSPFSNRLWALHASSALLRTSAKTRASFCVRIRNRNRSRTRFCDTAKISFLSLCHYFITKIMKAETDCLTTNSPNCLTAISWLLML